MSTQTSDKQIQPYPTSSKEGDAFAQALREPGPVGIIAFVAIVLSGNIVVGGMFVLPVGVICKGWRGCNRQRSSG